MRRRRHLIATAAVVAAIAAALAGCGGDDGPKIPRADARTLVARLQEADRRTDPLRCDDLSEDTIPALEQTADGLPEGDTKDTVVEAIDHLRDLIEADCTAKQNQETDTTDTTTETTETTTETEPPTTTETQPPTTTETTPPTETETTPTSPSGGTPPGQQKKQSKGGGE
jgi:hypothetical protein